MPEETLREQAGRISAPTYYQSRFSDDEIGAIRAATDPTVARIQGLVKAPAGL